MNKPFIVALFGVAYSLCGYIEVASAGPIAIANHSFEEVSLLDTQYIYSIQDWTLSHGGGIGTWNATNYRYFDDVSRVDGKQHAFLNGGQIAQQLTTGLVLGETYRLSALFGQPAPLDDPESDFAAAGGTLELWAGGTVANGDVSGGVLLGALVVDEADLVARRFVSLQTNIVAPTSGLLGGELLSIRFRSNGVESEIDNIQLSTSASTVPEPASLTLFAMGAVGLAMRRRHQANVRAS